jgi:hypothetical protein
MLLLVDLRGNLAARDMKAELQRGGRKSYILFLELEVLLTGAIWL